MASMSRVHFVAIAEAIRYLPLRECDRATVAEHLADCVSKFNGCFDRGRFLRAALEPLKRSSSCRTE